MNWSENGRISVEEVADRVNSTLEKYPVNGGASERKFGVNEKSSEKRFGESERSRINLKISGKQHRKSLISSFPTLQYQPKLWLIKLE